MQTFKPGDRVKVIADLPYRGCKVSYYGEGEYIGKEAEVIKVGDSIISLSQGEQFFGHFYPGELCLLKPEVKVEEEKPLFEGEFWMLRAEEKEREDKSAIGFIGGLWEDNGGSKNKRWIRVRVTEISE